MRSKHCPICGNESWAYDIVDYGTGWTFCGNCFQSARESKLFDKIDTAIKQAQQHHNNEIIMEVKV